MVEVEIRYNGHQDGDWCEVLVRTGDHEEKVYQGHGDIGPGHLAGILQTVGEVCDYDWIKVVYNPVYSFEH